MRLRTIHLPELKKRVVANLEDLIRMIHWNEENGIKVFRLSSSMFPHMSNPRAESYEFDFAKPLLKQIGDLGKKYNQRFTFHPGQYNVVGTPNEDSFRTTVLDLSYHANVLDLIGCDKNSVIVIHGGGTYGDKEATKKRWCKQFKMLPENVQSRLVLENCEKNFSVQDCLDVSKEIGIPVVFDTHHYNCYNHFHPTETQLPERHYIPLILETWHKRGIKPKFHISEQGSGRVGHHSDYIETIPKYLLEIPDKHNVHFDILVEAKKKELAIFQLYKKYPLLNCKKRKVIIKRRNTNQN
jgi:UV DNA damage endonuclease